jgi:hypothetical protein
LANGQRVTNYKWRGTTLPASRDYFMCRVTIRDMMWLTVLVAVCLAWFVQYEASLFGRVSLKYDYEMELYSDGKDSIILTEHHTPGFLGLPVWQVWRLSAGQEQPESMLTVEAAFQEREPGIPVVRETSDDVVITDELNSFAFSLSTNKFATNRVNNHVYSGPFRHAPPRRPH